MFTKSSIIFLFTVSILLACQSKKEGPGNSGEGRKASVAPDSSLAGIFSPLDGTWKGQFYVMSAKDNLPGLKPQPRIKSLKDLRSLNLDTTQVISVTQVYNSLNPFYQEVEITDVYLSSNNEEKSVRSTGFNAVNGNQLICEVNKPDEKVIHKGTHYPGNILVWERSETDPKRREYFYEQVKEDTYSIFGWGYYGDDDLNAPPKTWFLGIYKKIQ